MIKWDFEGSTFQGREYSICATNNWKLNRKSGFHLLFILPKSSNDGHIPVCLPRPLLNQHFSFSPSFQNLRLVGTRDNMSAELTRLRDSNSRSQSTLSEHFSAFCSPIRYWHPLEVDMIRSTWSSMVICDSYHGSRLHSSRINCRVWRTQHHAIIVIF
jgi:hypothetical protein